MQHIHFLHEVNIDRQRKSYSVCSIHFNSQMCTLCSKKPRCICMCQIQQKKLILIVIKQILRIMQGRILIEVQ
jgi:hypothetical protein